MHINKAKLLACGVLALSCYANAGCNLASYIQQPWKTVGFKTVECPQGILDKVNALSGKIPNLTLEFTAAEISGSMAERNCCENTTTGKASYAEASLTLKTEELNVFLYGINMRKKVQLPAILGSKWVKFDAGAGVSLETQLEIKGTGGVAENTCKNTSWKYGSFSSELDAGLAGNVWISLAQEKRLGTWKDLVDYSAKLGKAGLKMDVLLAYNSKEAPSGWGNSKANIKEVYIESSLNLIITKLEAHVVAYPGIKGKISCGSTEWAFAGDEISLTLTEGS